MGDSATTKPKLSPNDVVWINRGWQTAYIGFCPSATAWKRAMKRLGCPNEPYPQSAGRCSTFEKKGGIGGLTIIVSLGPAAEHANDTEIAGLIVHEATHVWQFVREHMGEKHPSVEFEAYSMQAIFQGLYDAYLDTKTPAQKEA